VKGIQQKESQLLPKRPSPGASGAFLILIGIGLFATTWLRLAWIPIWVAGLALLYWGVSRRRFRLIYAGGIITGTGLAIVVQTAPWINHVSETERTSLFLFCMSLGWLLIPGMSRLVFGKTTWWPLVPGLALCCAGAAFWFSNAWVKMVAPWIGPSLLLIAGLFLIFVWGRTR